jgi:ParB family chromosome partitioning protein
MPETMPDPTPAIHLIPLAEIDAAALTRDRAALDDEALGELRLSIAANGLRLPIELWPLTQPRKSDSGEHRYGLISGLRRLRAFEALHALTGNERYAAIPAFLRAPADYTAALAAMVEENEVRAQLSPWERGRVAMLAHYHEVYPTIEEAVEKLYPSANRQKRARLHNIARLVHELDGFLTAPERLSERQCLRIEAALRAGFDTVIKVALTESRSEAPEAQWRLLLPILAEAESVPPETAAPKRPGRPRRVLQPKRGLTFRREMTRDGWCLHLTGPLATSDFVDEIFDEIERLFAPG